MFNFNNNDTSTLLLLVVLGLLIWYIAKPKTNNVKDSPKTNNVKDSPKTNNVKDNTRSCSKSEDFTSYPNMSQPNYDASEHIQPSNYDVSEHMQPLNYDASKHIQPSNLIEETFINVNNKENLISNAAPVIFKPTKTMNKSGDFDGFDKNYNSSGSDINDAFNSLVPTSNTVISAIDINKQNVQNYNAKDFLPKEINDQWFNTDFSQAKTNLKDDKLINTDRFVIGINTVGQSLKNASYDIRGTVANPKYSVSPWNNSTYEPDYNIKPLC